jgi:hypothetical protein
MFFHLVLWSAEPNIATEREGQREWREGAREKDILAYWYPDISAVLVCHFVVGHTLGPYKLQVKT